MDMMDQPTLWTPAVEALHLQAHWDWPHGWQLHLKHRRAGRTWQSDLPVVYTELVTPEMLDVACAELEHLLGVERTP